MAGEPIITVVGNIARDPELKFAPSGMPFLNFTLANTPRSLDKATDQWVDGTTTWYRVTAFKKDAENGAESLNKGDRVVVVGRLSSEEWEDKEGQKRTSLKLMADEIGLSCKFKTVKAVEVERSSGKQAPKRRLEPVPDPWASSADEDEPPF